MRRILFRVLLLVLGGMGALLFFVLVLVKVGYRAMAWAGKTGPCPVAPFAWKWTLEAPMRVATVPSMLHWMRIQPDEQVLEVGTGPGVYSVPLARLLNPVGQLFAVDIQQPFLDEVKRRVQLAGLRNVKTIVGSAEQLPVADGSVDRVLLVDVLPEIPDQQRALREVARVLKERGHLNITGEFPDPDYMFSNEVIRLVETSGRFRLEQKRGNWWRYVLSFQRI